MAPLKYIITFLLTIEARLVLRKYKPKILAITGNIGKTTTKDLAYVVLKDKVDVRAAPKGYNDELGVPLTVLGCESAWSNPILWLSNLWIGLRLICTQQPYPEWLIVEVGADKPGDIKKLARWLRPDIAIITAVPAVPVHVVNFPSAAAVLEEKLTLAHYLREDGVLIYNADDERLAHKLAHTTHTAMTYGVTSEMAMLRATGIAVHYDAKAKPDGVQGTLHHGNETAHITLHGVLGTPRIYAALAAVAAGMQVGMTLNDAAAQLKDAVPTPGRLRILPGAHGSTIIDDSYNASPAAVNAALDTLASIATKGRRIAILGDMLELGEHSVHSHREIGVHASRCADMLITIGSQARLSAAAAEAAGMPGVRRYEPGESTKAGKELRDTLKEGDIILVKGSQGIRTERCVKEILDDPQEAKHLLVRQHGEWHKR